jgi:hypothetical protein
MAMPSWALVYRDAREGTRLVPSRGGRCRMFRVHAGAVDYAILAVYWLLIDA